MSSLAQDHEDHSTGRGRGAGDPLLCVTATELEVLEAAHLHGLAGHRPAAVREGADPEPAWMEAIASLTARGLLDGRGLLHEGTAAGQAAQTMLDVRLAASAVVVVERLVEAGGARRDLRLLHLLPLGAVVEDVHAEGLHGLDLALDARPLVDGTLAMLVPDGLVPDVPVEAGAAGQPGAVGLAAEAVPPAQTVEVDLGDPDGPARLPGLLGHPTVLAELSLAPAPAGEPGGPPPATTGHLVAIGPAGCWVAARADGLLRFRRVPVAWVRETLQTWVATVLEELYPEPGRQ